MIISLIKYIYILGGYYELIKPIIPQWNFKDSSFKNYIPDSKTLLN